MLDQLGELGPATGCGFESYHPHLPFPVVMPPARAALTCRAPEFTLDAMHAVEFTAELSGSATLAIPPEIVTQLPSTGTVRVIVLPAAAIGAEAEWRAASYEQFLARRLPGGCHLRFPALMFGEVFLCQFPFTSGAASKVRPALLLFDLGLDALICRVTSVQRIGPLDVPLTDWQAAGLLKPSVVRLDRLVTAERSVVFLRRLGTLSAADQGAIRTAWNSHLRL